MDELVVFDFDFTIAATYENILVFSPRGEKIFKNKTYRSVHPLEIQKFGIYDDETITEDSFVEFYSLDSNRSKIIKPILPYLYHYSNKELHILTARPQSIENKVIKFLSQYIETSNINFNGLTNSSWKKKQEWILNKMKKHDKLVLFEDNKKLIDDLRKFDFKKDLYHIDYDHNSTKITFTQ